jgi:ubiquinone/menaquinone biosynthesis C-methylase UbiE
VEHPGRSGPDWSRPGWSSIAEWYDALLRSGKGPHAFATEVTLRLAGDVPGLEVLDVGCGQGIAARALARAGARVTAADVTPEMLDAARAHEAAEPLGIRYVLADAQRLDGLAGDSFDLVTCQLALMDIPDLDATLAAVARVLRPGGAFVASVGHPCFLAPYASTVADADGGTGRFVSRYLTEGFWRSDNPEGVRRAGNHHRTLATYLTALVAAGFGLEAVDEPRATGSFAAEQPVYTEVPMLLAFRARLTGPRGAR